MNQSQIECYEFVVDALSILNIDMGDKTRLHALFDSRLHLLKYDFAIFLEIWFDNALAKASSGQRQQYASLVGNLGLALSCFEKGDIGVNKLIAIKAYECALLVFTKKKDPLNWANTALNIGNCYVGMAEYSRQPITCLDDAINLLKDVVTVFGEIRDQMGQAKALNSLGNAFLDKSDLVLHPGGFIAKAISLYKESISLSEAERDDSSTACALNNLGNAYRAMAWITVDPTYYKSKCKEAHLNSLEIRATLNEIGAWATSMNDLANAYHDFARFESDPRTSYRSAAIGYTKALRVTPRDVYPMDYASTSTNLGNCRISLASHSPVLDRKKLIQKAILSYNNAIQCYDSKAHSRQWAILNTYIANAMIELLPHIECPDGYIDSIFKSYEDALHVFSGQRSPRDIASVQFGLGLSHLRLAQAGKDEERNARRSISALVSALEVYTEADHPSRWAFINSSLGEALIILSSFERNSKDCVQEAVERFNNALRIQDPLGHSAECLRTSLKLGNLALEHNMQALATSSYSIAIAAAEGLRVVSLGPQERARTLSRAMRAYSSLFSLYINQGLYDKALEVVDRSKTRNLVDLLADRDLYPRGDVDPDVVADLDRLRGLIARSERALSNSLSDNDLSSLRPPRLASYSVALNYSSMKLDEHSTVPFLGLSPARLKSLKEELYCLVKDQILPIDPGFLLSQKVQSLTFTEIKAILPDERTALVSWYIAGESLVALVTTADSNMPACHVYAEGTFKKLVNLCNSYLNAYGSSQRLWALSLSDRLTEFSGLLEIEILVEKIMSLNPNVDQLVFVPHRFLHMFPLHCLPMPQSNSTVLESFARGVRFAPSLQVLDIVQKRESLELSSLFAIQNPTEDLPFSDLEVESIQVLFESDVTVLRRRQASRRNLELMKNVLKGIRCLHFACHGKFNFFEPDSSVLVLAGGESRDPPAQNNDHDSHPLGNDGIASDYSRCISLLDLFEFDLRQARIVSLSACETALAEVNGLSDEYVGLGSGFLYAGCNTVVGTLWSVSDLSTCLLMGKFYRLLKVQEKTGNYSDAAVALKQAQLWLRGLTRDKVLHQIRQLEKVSSGPSMKDCAVAFSMIASNYGPDELIFSNPYYWAGYLVVGR